MINKIRPILKKILSEKTYFLLRPIYRKLKYPINELIEFFKHTMRYYSLFNPDYKINLNLGFGNKESEFFTTELKKSKFYLEYGTGKSTLLALELKKNFIAVESDKNFYNYMINKLKDKSLINFVNFGIVKFASIPIFFDLTKEKMSKIAYQYNFNILNKLKEKEKIPDFVLVDGRYRVLTGIALYKFYKKNSEDFTIIFDDYFKRDFYSTLNDLFYFEQIGRFGVTKKIKDFDENKLDKLVEIYKRDYR